MVVDGHAIEPNGRFENCIKQVVGGEIGSMETMAVVVVCGG